MEARQRPFMHLSCLEAHATPRRESGGRAPCNPPLYLPAPADTRDGAGFAHSVVLEYTHAHETKGEKKRTKNGPKVPREIEKTNNPWKGPASNQGRRFARGSAERPGM